MKIQCDVCNKDEASVFCSADEAALCAACDHRVHHANKLAGKHQRFALQHPSPKQFPLCDICQEKRAFLFCQQDRAILCRNCDISIHEANEHTRNHDRFLLTGVKLSATSSLYSSQSSSDSSAANNDLLPNLKSQNSIATTTNSNKPIALQPTIAKTVTAETVVATTANKGVEGGAATSSISEYLTETLPGWRVDDFLDSSSPTSFGIYKTVVDEVMPLWDGDLESNLGSFSSPNNVGIWVPQAPPPQYPHQYSSPNMGFGNQIGFKESKEATINKNKNNNNDNNNNKSGRKWRDGGCFIVPQISPSSIAASKRSRTYRNLKKAKRVTLFRFRKAKKQLPLRKNTSAGGSGGGCYCCFKQTPSSDSPVESQTSDPNSPEFTYELLRALIEKNDFYSNECNPHLDSDNKDVN